MPHESRSASSGMTSLDTPFSGNLTDCDARHRLKMSCCVNVSVLRCGVRIGFTSAYWESRAWGNLYSKRASTQWCECVLQMRTLHLRSFLQSLEHLAPLKSD